MRLFFAVRIDDEVCDAVSGAIDGSPLRKAPWRWIPRENYHITLKFLGETGSDLVGSIMEAGRSAASLSSPFRISFERFGGFPDLGRPRVLFYSARDGRDELSGLASHVESAVEPLGFEREKKPFRAHLTLARIKLPVSPEISALLARMPVLDCAAASQDVKRFVLMKSDLTRSGAQYEELAGFDLGH